MKTSLIAVFFLLLGVGCQNAEPQTASDSNSKVFCSPKGELVRTQTIQSYRSYCLQRQKQEPVANQPIDFSFAIIDDQGKQITELNVANEEKTHAILIQRDLATFIHFHPELDSSSGAFTLKNLTLLNQGTYYLYVYFTPKNSPIDTNNTARQVVVSDTLVVGNGTTNQTANLSDMTLAKTVDRFTVRLQPQTLKSGVEAKLNFQVQGKNEQPIEQVSLYEGQLGNVVIFKADTMEPVLGTVERPITNIYNQIPFSTVFPSTGKYKVWLEFKYGQKVYTVDYNIEVK